MVLLKNDGILPLMTKKKIAVVGPGSLTQKGLVGPYFGNYIITPCVFLAPENS